MSTAAEARKVILNKVILFSPMDIRTIHSVPSLLLRLTTEIRHVQNSGAVCMSDCSERSALVPQSTPNNLGYVRDIVSAKPFTNFD